MAETLEGLIGQLCLLIALWISRVNGTTSVFMSCASLRSAWKRMSTLGNMWRSTTFKCSRAVVIAMGSCCERSWALVFLVPLQVDERIVQDDQSHGALAG